MHDLQFDMYEGKSSFVQRECFKITLHKIHINSFRVRMISYCIFLEDGKELQAASVVRKSLVMQFLCVHLACKFYL